MIGATPTPPINGGIFIDTHELIFGDPVRMESVANPTVMLKLPPQTHARLTRKKVISSTQVNGREGSIKEISGVGDWEIELEGELIAADYKLTPVSLLEQTRRVVTLFKESGKVKIVNDRLAVMGIEFVAVESIEFEDNTYNSQHFKLRCLSDFDYKLDYFKPKPAASA